MVWMIAQALAGCDPSGIDELVDVLPKAGAEYQEMVAATAFAQSCTTPAGLVKAARDLPVVSPDMRPMIDMRAATDAPGAWMAVCTGSTEGLRILGKMMELPRSQQRDHLWTGCDLGSLGWFTQEEWRTANGSIVVALAGAKHAADEGIPARKVRILARALAGIGGESRPPRETFEDALIEPMLLPALDRYEASGEGPAGRGDMEETEGASFRKRVEPSWSGKALKEGGSCTVRVFVSKEAELRNLEFVDCPKPLQKDVEKAVEASRLKPRLKDGRKAAGRFTATYTVD